MISNQDRQTLKRVIPALEILKDQVEEGFSLTDEDAIRLLENIIAIFEEVVA